MNFIAESAPHFRPYSTLLLSLILTPVNFSEGGGERIGGDGGKGEGGSFGGGVTMRGDGERRNDGGTRQQVRGEREGGGGSGSGGVGNRLLREDEVVEVLDGVRGGSGRETTEGLDDLGSGLKKTGVTFITNKGIERVLKKDNGSVEGAKKGVATTGQRSGGLEKVQESFGIDGGGEVKEGGVEAGEIGGKDEEGCGERRIREAEDIGERGIGGKGIGSEVGGREARVSRGLPFGLQRDDPDNICLQAMHFSGAQQQLSPEGQRRRNNDTMMTTTMTMTMTLKSSEEESGGGGTAHSNRFVITVNATKYIPGQTLTVTVSSPIPYRGFLLQARRYGSPVVVGSFLNPPSEASNETDDLVFFNCDGLSDTILAWLPRTVSNVTAVWLPSNEDFGLIQFVATLFISEIDFRSNVSSKVLRKGFRSIELDGCGKLKGCFRYLNEGSGACDADTCQYLATYQVLDTEAQFELSALADWVSIAFSSDERMGGDDVFMCVRNRWTVDVRRYVTEVGYQTPIQKEMSPLYDVQGEVGEDERVSCRFRRSLKVTHDSEDQFSIDLNNNWFQLYAWGPVSASGGILRHNLDRPPTSQTKLSLRPTRNEFLTGSGSRPVPPTSAILLPSAVAAALLRLLLPIAHQQQLVCCLILFVVILSMTDGPCRLN